MLLDMRRQKLVIISARPFESRFNQFARDIFWFTMLQTFKISLKPGAMAIWSASFMGMNRTTLTVGTSPWFTTPLLTTGLGLIADDSFAWFNGAAAALITGFDLDFTIAAKGEPVLGSFVSPDIFDGTCTVTGTVTGMRTTFANPILYDAETEFELGILLAAPGTAPVDTLAVYLPRVKLASLAAPVGGGDGPKIETMTLDIAPKVAVAGYDGTIAVVSSSAP